MNTVEMIYGKGAAMRMQTERALLSNYSVSCGCPNIDQYSDCLDCPVATWDYRPYWVKTETCALKMSCVVRCFPCPCNVLATPETLETNMQIHDAMEAKLGL